MNSVLCGGVQPGGSVAAGGSAVHAVRPVFPWVRTGCSAASTAAGFVEVWSTIRLLIVRGCETTTLLFLFAEAVGPAPGGPNGPVSSAALNPPGFASRGNGWSAVAKV